MNCNMLRERLLAGGVRRLTTGVDMDGRAVIMRDETVAGDPRGLIVWAADKSTSAGDATPPVTQHWWPPPGGVRVTLSTRAPDTAGDAPHHSAGHPFPDIHDAAGFHASCSVDVMIVISGRIWLELDDGVEVELKGGDILVQNGARHRWRNRSEEWPVMAVVIVGAHP